jgi:nucleoside-diphosphate-sugar epimerase
LVHRINVVAAYNVLQTAAARGVRRMVQASSCNALGLSWTMPEHWGLDFVPINETHPMRPVSQSISLGDTTDIRKEDPYSLSKL